jgi:hypothetical protein
VVLIGTDRVYVRPQYHNRCIVQNYSRGLERSFQTQPPAASLLCDPNTAACPSFFTHTARQSLRPNRTISN